MKQTTLKVGELLTLVSLTLVLIIITKVVWREEVDCFFSAAHLNEQWQTVKI